MVRVDGDLDPESGAVFLTALEALTGPVMRSSDDHRTPAQARADALVDICRDSLHRGDAPITGGERPHVSLVVDLAVLDGATGRSEVADGVVVTGETARRLLCDAGVSRVITKGPSDPLDVGRRTRVVPPAIRRALEMRDGGCVIAGCRRPHRWCNAHHVVHWADGGPTSLDNLVLLCRRHHRLVHEGEIDLPARE